jgi:AraC-like DNA-binding protein
MIFHVVWTAFKGRRDDLVERRRRVRFWFALGIAAATLISVATDEFMRRDQPDDAAFILAVIIGALTLWGALWLLRLIPESLKFEEPALAEPQAPRINPKEAAAHRRLIALMETEKAFLEPGLTIGALAQSVGVPEHQLRALINGALGHRNFASFLNGYRIAHAKAVLSDPGQVRLPILTIALDSGFSSLAPFNRAFRAAEGVTPSEFRAKALNNT